MLFFYFKKIYFFYSVNKIKNKNKNNIRYPKKESVRYLLIRDINDSLPSGQS